MALAGTMGVDYVPDAILSRSIIIRMQRALPGEVAERWNERLHAFEVEPLCWLLRYWIELVHGYAHEHRPDIPESLTNRDADKWEPLLTMAELAGGHWPERARVAGVVGVRFGKQPHPARVSSCCGRIQAVFDERQVDRIHTEALMAELSDEDSVGRSRPVR